MRISDWSSDVCSSDLQIVLGDAELEMLAARRLAPALGRDDLDLAEHVLAFATREDATLVDRKSVVEGKSVSVLVDLGGRRIIKKKTTKNNKLSLSSNSHTIYDKDTCHNKTQIN